MPDGCPDMVGTTNDLVCNSAEWTTTGGKIIGACMWIMPCIGNHRITITGNNKRQCRWPRYDNYVLMRVVGRPLSLCCWFISLAFRSMSCKGKCRASAGIYKRSTNIHRESTNIYRTSESKQTSKQAGKQTSTQ